MIDRWLLSAEQLGRLPIMARDLPADLDAIVCSPLFNPTCYYPPGVILAGGEFGHDQEYRYVHPTGWRIAAERALQSSNYIGYIPPLDGPVYDKNFALTSGGEAS